MIDYCSLVLVVASSIRAERGIDTLTMGSIKKVFAVALIASALAVSEAESVKGRYVWRRLTTASDRAGLSMGIHASIET